MEKSFFIYLIAFLVVIGILGYAFFINNASQNEYLDDNLNISNWQEYNNKNFEFSLKYPSDWVFEYLISEEESIASDSGNISIFKENSSATSRYTFQLIWENNQGRYDCKQYVDNKYESELEEYLNNNVGGDPGDEFTIGIKKIFSPVNIIEINGLEVCQLPDLFGGDRKFEHYVLINGDYVYDITFETTSSPSENALNPKENNAIAHEILKTINFNKKIWPAQSDFANSQNTNADFYYNSASSNPGYSVFSSLTYNFTFKVDQAIDYKVEQSSAPILLEVLFSAPNPNSSEEPNRETPNGFNLSPVNSFLLMIYPNTHQITADDQASFRAWVNEALIDKIDGVIETESIAANDFLKSIQADGVESFAVYYYLVKSDYIYVFRTNDFTNIQMREFLSGFSTEE